MAVYQVTMDKTITMSVMIEANTMESALAIGKEQMITEDETAFIEDTIYGTPEAYEVEVEL
jgi:hypothetical protein